MGLRQHFLKRLRTVHGLWKARVRHLLIGLFLILAPQPTTEYDSGRRPDGEEDGDLGRGGEPRPMYLGRE